MRCGIPEIIDYELHPYYSYPRVQISRFIMRIDDCCQRQWKKLWKSWLNAVLRNDRKSFSGEERKAKKKKRGWQNVEKEESSPLKCQQQNEVIFIFFLSFDILTEQIKIHGIKLNVLLPLQTFFDFDFYVFIIFFSRQKFFFLFLLCDTPLRFLLFFKCRE